MTALRAFIAIGLAAVLLGIAAPHMFEKLPSVNTGVTRATNTLFAPNIIRVARASPAARAGLHTGDQVACLSPRDHAVLFPRFGFAAYTPGMTIHLCVRKAHGWSALTFEPQPGPTPGYLYYTIPLTIVRLGVFAVFLFCGVALVLARPSVLTWLFYGFCLGAGPFYAEVTYGTAQPPALYAFATALTAFVSTTAVVWLLLFALAVPDDRVPSGWRRTTFLITSAIAIPTALNALAVPLWTSVVITQQSLIVVDELFTTAAVLVVLVRLFEVHGEARARLSWAAFALIWGVVTNDLRFYVSQPGQVIDLLTTTAADLTIVMPIAMMYAILKRHVIDVRFVISRTLVYAVLTTFVVSFIGLADWATSAFLHEARVAMALDALVTIALGFLLHRTYRWLEQIMDFLLFRQKHEAESYLHRLARTLPFAQSEEAVNEALVYAPVERLRLKGAALFRRHSEGFAAAASAGWNVLELPPFAHDHDMLRFLASERRAFFIRDLHAHARKGLLAGSESPAIAVPVFQSNTLIGFALYALHRDGTQLDPDEIETLERLCETAGQAYTGIELAQLRKAQAAVPVSVAPMAG